MSPGVLDPGNYPQDPQLNFAFFALFYEWNISPHMSGISAPTWMEYQPPHIWNINPRLNGISATHLLEDTSLLKSWSVVCVSTKTNKVRFGCLDVCVMMHVLLCVGFRICGSMQKLCHVCFYAHALNRFSFPSLFSKHIFIPMCGHKV